MAVWLAGLLGHLQTVMTKLVDKYMSEGNCCYRDAQSAKMSEWSDSACNKGRECQRSHTSNPQASIRNVRIGNLLNGMS